MGHLQNRRLLLPRLRPNLRAWGLCLLASLTLPQPHEAYAKAPVATTARVKPAKGASGIDVAPYTAHYGVYVGGAKVGWMRSSYALQPVPTLAYHLEAQVRGMGRTTPVTVEETRTYDPKSRALTRLDFRQKADSGEMTVKGKAIAQGFECTTTAGGAEHVSTIRGTETLEDVLALYPLVTRKGAQAGDHKKVRHLDPQALQVSDVELHIDAVTDTMVAGIATKMFTVTTHHVAMGVKEQSTLNSTGQLIATHMGGFFEARLEPEEVAKEPSQAQDLLLQAVVKAPQALSHPEALEGLTLTMTGFDDAPPPASERQQVERVEKGWRLTLKKDAPFEPVPYPEHAAAKRPQEVVEATLPTAFIQSTAPDIVRASRAATQGAKTMPQAIDQLVAYVQSHLRAEYVPAFSNALEALHTGRGDCTEYSVLFVALARAAHIPARVAVGVAYWPPGKGFGWHAWAEVYAHGRWISVDPTWGQSISDVTHLKFAEGGPTEQARVVMLLGRLNIVDMLVP